MTSCEQSTSTQVGSVFSLVVFLDNLFHLGRCQESHGDKYLSLRAPTSTFVLVSPSLARLVSFLSRRMSFDICILHFFNSFLKCAATTGTCSSGAQPRWSTGWSRRMRRRTMKRTRETVRGCDFPGKGKEDQDRLYGAGRWVLKDLHDLSSWYF